MNICIKSAITKSIGIQDNFLYDHYIESDGTVKCYRIYLLIFLNLKLESDKLSKLVIY